MPKANVGNTQDLVEVREIRDNTLILKDGTMRQVIMVSGINFALKSEVEQNLITAAYQNFLNSIDFPLQIIIHSRKINIERYLQKLEAFEKNEPSPLLQNQNAEYREFIRGFVEKNAIMEKTFFVVVPWTPSVITSAQKTISGIFQFLPFFKKKNAAEQKSAAQQNISASNEQKSEENGQENSKEDELKNELEQLNKRTEEVLEGLSAIGLDATILDNEQLTELLYNFYNPETVERKTIE